MVNKCGVCRKELNNSEINYCKRHISYNEKISSKKKRLVIDEEFYWELKTDASSNSMELKDYIKMMFEDLREERNRENSDMNKNN